MGELAYLQEWDGVSWVTIASQVTDGDGMVYFHNLIKEKPGTFYYRGYLPGRGLVTNMIVARVIATTGTIAIEQSDYSDITGVMRIFVNDADMNIQSGSMDKVSVSIVSYDTITRQNVDTINQFSLDETSVNSGQFMGWLLFTTNTADEHHIKVTDENPGLFIVSYRDNPDELGNIELKSITSNYKFCASLEGRIWNINRISSENIQISPVEGANVWLIPNGQTTAQYNTVTDGIGAYSFPGVKPETYTINVYWRDSWASSPHEYNRALEMQGGKKYYVEFPENILDVMKATYKEKAALDYARLIKKYNDINEQVTIIGLALSPLSVGYSVHSSYIGSSGLTLLNVIKITASEQAGNILSQFNNNLFAGWSAKNALNSLEDIINDPPDINYTTVFEYNPPNPILFPEDYNGSVTVSGLQMANQLNEWAFLEDALLVSFERYQGALEANKQQYMVLQLQAVKYYADQLIEREPDFNNTISLVIAEIKSNSEETDSSVLEIKQRLLSKGYTTEEKAELRNIGMTDEDLHKYSDLWLQFNSTDIITGLEDLKVSINSRAESAREMSAQAEATIEYLNNGEIPDLTPPLPIRDLRNTTCLHDSITWVWLDPADPDFAKVMIYVDNQFQANVSKSVQMFTATNLNSNTNYSIGSRTVDNSENVNLTWVNQTARTKLLGDAHIATVGIFRDGVFYLKDATAFAYGLAGDNPVVGDWNGDGISEVGVYRDGVFYRNGADAVEYGFSTDTPVVGDWNGDHISEVGVFRGGVFYRNGADAIAYGLSTDTPVIGNWNGDHISEVGVYRDGVFYRNGADAIVYGLSTDTPVIGDWNGDGMSEVGVYRDGVFYRNGADAIVYGLSTDTPVIGKWT